MHSPLTTRACCARVTHYGLPVLRVDGSSKINNEVFEAYAYIALECMRANMTKKKHSIPPLWVAFVIGPTGAPARYNLHPITTAGLYL